MAIIPVVKNLRLKAKLAKCDPRRAKRHARRDMYQLPVRRMRHFHRLSPPDTFEPSRGSARGPKAPKPIEVSSNYLPNIIPRKLRVRSFSQPSGRKVDPFVAELAGKPVDYLRNAWAAMGVRCVASVYHCIAQLIEPRMCSSIGIYKHITIDPPKRLLKYLNVMVTDGGLAAWPTNVFVVHNSAPWPPSPALRLAHCPGYRRSAFLFPVRPLIWLTNCSKLPPIPPKEAPGYSHAKQDPRLPPASHLRLPTVRVRVPCAEAFDPLQRYLHTQDFVILIRALIPTLPPDPELKTIEQVWPRFTDDLATCCNRRELAVFARRLLGLYKNMIALRISDKTFWEGVAKMWDCLVEAIESKNEEEQVTVPSSDLYVCIPADQ